MYTYVAAPVILRGSFVPRPSVIPRGNIRVRIGTPAYVYSGFNVRVECHLVKGSHPVTITWFRNGSHYPTRRNAFIIILTHPSNGDVFKCRANNIIGNDTSGNTTIHVEYGKCICMLYTVYYKSMCLFWSIVCFNNICMCVCVCMQH